jgi:putative ABC transport system ATP-binding protein
VIVLDNIIKTYQEAHNVISVFDGFSTTIDSATRNVILGSSGSGKSSFLNMIAALDDPDSGRITIDGLDITKLNQSDKTVFRRENIGFIFQFFNLISTLSVKDNILLPLELNNKNTLDNQNYVFGLLDKVGLLSRLDSMPENLSGGEQQRIAIVRALSHKPKIIIADEPTGNLDKDTARVIMEILNNLIKESQTTLIMATHDEGLIGFADNVFEVKNKALEKK